MEIKRPTDLIRHLEDVFAKFESKLTNFPADHCSVLRQSFSAEVRQYVVSTEKATTRRLSGRVRLCDLFGSAGALSNDHCGKKGHKAE